MAIDEQAYLLFIASIFFKMITDRTAFKHRMKAGHGYLSALKIKHLK